MKRTEATKTLLTVSATWTLVQIAESADGSEVATGLLQQLIPAIHTQLGM